MTFPTTLPFGFGEVSEPNPEPPFFQWPTTSTGLTSGTEVVTNDQIVSLHTRTGVQLFQFLPSDYTTLSWSRSIRDVSRCGLVAPPDGDVDRFADILPWMHWISVFDGSDNSLLWTGPIQKPRISRRGLTIEARDSGAYLSRTRNPLTKRWEAADPAVIAAELWDSMIDQKGLGQKPIVRPDPEGERFDFRVVGDAQMLDQTMTDLVQLGLRWSVVNGVPILGPMPLDPVVTLGEDDFEGESGIELVTDGSATYNDVLVQGPGNLARASTPLFGERLESLVKVDSVSGVSNVQRAANEYVRHTSTFRRALEMPEGVTLHPSAPISIEELIPSTRLIITAYGVRQLFELETVNVSRAAGKSTVSITLEAVNDLPELLDTNLGDPARAGTAL